MTLGALPVGWEPPWVGPYAGEVFVNQLGSHLMSTLRGKRVRMVQVRSSVFELVLPASASVSGFEVRGAEARLRVPNHTLMYGFDASVSAAYRGRRVGVDRIEGECALVLAGDSTRLVALTELEQLTMDAYSFTFTNSTSSYHITTDGVLRWRAVLPFADRLRCDGLPGALTLEQWPSPFVGPVPWDGGRYTVVDSVLLSGDRVDGEMYHRAGMVNCVDVPGWAPSPEGVRGEFSGGFWGAMLRDDRVDGSIEVGQVTATWRGRRVEVMYVAYAYAYVIDHVPGSDYRANRLRAHRDRAIFDGLQGPVRLDELRDIVFDVDVVWRNPDSGPWPFFEFWGLDPELTGRATAHVERGGWPAWPWKTTADQGAA